MQGDKCALVITSSVQVSARYTVLRDPGEREQQYLDSIAFYIRESPLSRIIVCDNTGHVYPPSLVELAEAHHKELELLSFTGNNILVERYGKGYGEGEIMEFIFANSRLLRTVEGFLKVTGRLRVVNIGRLLAKADHRENYFMPIALLRPRFMVARAARTCVHVNVYYSTRAFFVEVLRHAYRQVRDDQVYFLEHAYHDAIAAAPSSFRVKCFPVAPEITGISGSNGWVLKERSGFKKLLTRLVLRLGYVKPVNKKHNAARQH